MLLLIWLNQRAFKQSWHEPFPSVKLIQGCNVDKPSVTRGPVCDVM